MNIPIEQLGLSGATVLGGIISLIVMWVRFQNKVDNLVDKDVDQENKLKNLFSWKDAHTEDANNHRLKFEIELAETRGQIKGMKESQDGH